ncbi:hypothetical protein ATR1_012d0027 [Acetobacter tropicalis]|nr:hypothetical protein ATR1_012d0027 [Acetobacter tropicalis]
MRREKGRGDQLPFFPRLGCLGVKAACCEQPKRTPSTQKKTMGRPSNQRPEAFPASMGFWGHSYP